MNLAATEPVTIPWAEYGLLGIVLGAGFILLYRHGTEIIRLLGTLVQRVTAIEVTTTMHAGTLAEVKAAADKVEAKVDLHGEALAIIGRDAARALEHTTGNLRQMCIGNMEEIKLLDHRVTVLEEVVKIIPPPKKKTDG